LFLFTDNEERVVFHVAAAYCEVKVFQVILNWAKENLTKQEVNKLFLATDNEGRMVFHVAAVFSNVEIFQVIMNMAKEN
jgi:hypothetical protein